MPRRIIEGGFGGGSRNRRWVLAGVQVGQPVCALADPAHLIDQAVADQVAPVQLAQGGIQLVQVRGGRDLVHPGRGKPRRGRQLADRDSFRAGRGRRPGAFPLGLVQAPRRPPQHPPFPPPDGHPVRDPHDDILAGAQ